SRKRGSDRPGPGRDRRRHSRSGGSGRISCSFRRPRLQLGHDRREPLPCRKGAFEIMGEGDVPERIFGPGYLDTEPRCTLAQYLHGLVEIEVVEMLVMDAGILLVPEHHRLPEQADPYLMSFVAVDDLAAVGQRPAVTIGD